MRTHPSVAVIGGGFATVLGATMASAVSPAAAAVVGVVGAMASAVWAVRLRTSPQQALIERIDGRVFFEGHRLALEGAVVVHHSVEERSSRNGKYYVPILDVSAPTDHGQQSLMVVENHIVEVRCFAEALCKASGLRLQWISNRTTEERNARDLDLPLAVRARQAPPVRTRRTGNETFDEEKLPDGVRLTSRYDQSVTTQIENLIARPVLDIRRSGIEFRSRLLGVFAVAHAKVDGRDLESVYIQDHRRHRLPVFLSDDKATPVGFPLSSYDVDRFMMLVATASAGLLEEDLPDTAPEAPRYVIHADGSTPYAPVTRPSSSTTTDCPLCPLTPLDDEVGDLGERSCPTCEGRLLSPAGTEQLLQHELHIERGLLLDVLEHYAVSSFDCPACQTTMSRAPVAGVSVDFCKGCGAMWLDAKELGAMTQHRRPG